MVNDRNRLYPAIRLKQENKSKALYDVVNLYKNAFWVFRCFQPVYDGAITATDALSFGIMNFY